MGRSVPSFRQQLDRETERLRRLAEGSADPRRKALLLELLEHARDLENEFAVSGGDAAEEVLFSLLLHLFARERNSLERTGR